MRTNIVIDNQLMAEAMEITGIQTKREVVDLALRMLVRVKKQRKVLELAGKISWEGDLEQMRLERFAAESDIDYHAHSG
ncbi:MAG: type II toxin-antitoxin system VapB family antitoxin [Chloroflexi bacterium]|nr:type II toxin-antitoxin system VapB family antitoxin [Chloroflexota bacterium]